MLHCFISKNVMLLLWKVHSFISNKKIGYLRSLFLFIKNAKNFIHIYNNYNYNFIFGNLLWKLLVQLMQYWELRVRNVAAGIQNVVIAYFWHLRELELLSGNHRILNWMHMNSNYDLYFGKYKLNSLTSINVVLIMRNETAGIHHVVSAYFWRLRELELLRGNDRILNCNQCSIKSGKGDYRHTKCS